MEYGEEQAAEAHQMDDDQTTYRLHPNNESFSSELLEANTTRANQFQATGYHTNGQEMAQASEQQPQTIDGPA